MISKTSEQSDCRAKLVRIFDLIKQLLKQLQEMLETNRNFDEENLLMTRLGYPRK